MKCIFLVVAIVSMFVACKESVSKQLVPVIRNDTTTAVVVKKDFSKVVVASKKDLSCGMPLTAGLEDSFHYKGKIYGFCSAECKADFIKNAAVYVK